jgi:hypothetical protein
MFNPKTEPVRGIRKRRGGSGCMRTMRTQAEHRLNQVIDDEPRCRADRNGRNLPNAWWDLLINRQRCWKAQRRGVKAWDRR